MKLVGMMPVRNESWCLGLTARAALMWCDELVILDHASTDGTQDILSDLRGEFGDSERDYPYDGRVTWIHEQDGKWDEMRHRQRLLQAAQCRKATHLAIIDADEIVSGNLIDQPRPAIRDYIEAIEGRMFDPPLYNLRGGIDRYHANGLWGNRTVSLAFKDDPALHWAGDTFHRREPQGKRLHSFNPIPQGGGGVMHLWGASERRLLAKHAMYKVTERLRWPHKNVHDIDFMYSQCVKGGLRENPVDWKYTDVPESWWAPYEGLLRYLDVDAEPWQETEVKRLIAEHGREKFSGLDLFGVA